MIAGGVSRRARLGGEELAEDPRTLRHMRAAVACGKHRTLSRSLKESSRGRSDGKPERRMRPRVGSKVRSTGQGARSPFDGAADRSKTRDPAVDTFDGPPTAVAHRTQRLACVSRETLTAPRRPRENRRCSSTVMSHRWPLAATFLPAERELDRYRESRASHVLDVMANVRSAPSSTTRRHPRDQPPTVATAAPTDDRSTGMPAGTRSARRRHRLGRRVQVLGGGASRHHASVRNAVRHDHPRRRCRLRASHDRAKARAPQCSCASMDEGAEHERHQRHNG